MKSGSLKKAGRIAVSILLYAFLAVCLLGVIVTISSKKDRDGTATVFGMQMRVVQTPSMEKCDDTDVSQFEIKDIPVGSMVFINTVPQGKEEAQQFYAGLRPGDVLTFKYVIDSKQITITHRIIDIKENGTGGYLISLRGDNKSDDTQAGVQLIDTSQTSSPNYVVGKVVGQSRAVGLFVRILSSPIGIVCVVILPALVILVLEVMKIVRILGGSKKEKDLEEKKAQDEELQRLRARLAELEGKSVPEAGDDAPPKDDINGEQP